MKNVIFATQTICNPNMEFIIILFLLILNGIFAMYEIALVSSSKGTFGNPCKQRDKKVQKAF